MDSSGDINFLLKQKFAPMRFARFTINYFEEDAVNELLERQEGKESFNKILYGVYKHDDDAVCYLESTYFQKKNENHLILKVTKLHKHLIWYPSCPWNDAIGKNPKHIRHLVLQNHNEASKYVDKMVVRMLWMCRRLWVVV